MENIIASTMGLKPSSSGETFRLLTSKIVNSCQKNQRSGASCSGGAEAPVANLGFGFYARQMGLIKVFV